MGKVLLGMLLGVVLLFLVIAFVGVNSRHDESTASVATRAAMEAPVALSVTAPKLWPDYQANEVAADNVYKGKQLLVEGAVNGINKDFTDSIYITLSTFNEFESVHAEINGNYQTEAASLRRGQIIKVRCEGGGMVIGSPVLRDCSIQPNAATVSESQPQAQPQPQISNVSSAPVAVDEPQENTPNTAGAVTHDITTPVLLSTAPAEYTPEARQNKLNGTVKVVLTVDEEGNPQNVMVAKSLGMGLDESAIEAVKHYRFKPAFDRQAGKSVPAQMSVNVDFRLY